MSAVEFTTRAFERSHGRKPRSSTLGTWALQTSTSSTAFAHELTGDVLFVNSSTLTEAKRAARAAGLGPIVAVLP